MARNNAMPWDKLRPIHQTKPVAIAAAVAAGSRYLIALSLIHGPLYSRDRGYDFKGEKPEKPGAMSPNTAPETLDLSYD